MQISSLKHKMPLPFKLLVKEDFLKMIFQSICGINPWVFRLQ